MSIDKKKSLLFIKDVKSKFNSDITKFSDLFSTVDVVEKDEATKLLFLNKHDLVVADLSVDPRRAGLLKEFKDKNSKQVMFALMSPKDADKLYGIADLGINAFELIPEQLEQALEAIANFEGQ